jgi:hypothetical protein
MSTTFILGHEIKAPSRRIKGCSLNLLLSVMACVIRSNSRIAQVFRSTEIGRLFLTNSLQIKDLPATSKPFCWNALVRP